MAELTGIDYNVTNDYVFPWKGLRTMPINKKEMQKKRVMTYFIEATEELMEECGINCITIRKVADKAGYNSATLYNYFENLDHLIFYAAMKHMKEYVMDLENYLKNATNAMDRFLLVWECFCEHAYSKPEIYNAIFFPRLEKAMDYYILEYYKFFPDDLGVHDKIISEMLTKRDISKRGEATVIGCVEDGYIRNEDMGKLNDMTLLIFEGMLMRVLSDRISPEKAKLTTMDYIKTIVREFLKKDYSFSL